MGRCSFVVGSVLALAGIGVAHADPVEDFYRDKTITISVGFGPGGGYDLHARTLARHIGRFIPGHPNVIVKNAPGGAGLTLVNTLNTIAPRDGTELATFDRSIPLEPLIGKAHSSFDPLRMSWIGSTTREVSTCVAWESAKVTTIEDLRTKGLVTSGTGPSADVVVYPRVMNAILGTRFQIVMGYKDSAEALLAMQRGETQGFCAWGWSTINATHPDWLRDGKIKVLVQFGFQKDAGHPEIPLVLDLARNDNDRTALELVIAPQMFARPFAGPPGIPAERLAALRKAFDETVRDPAYLADAQGLGIEISLVTGREIDDLLAKIYQTPRATVERVRAALE